LPNGQYSAAMPMSLTYTPEESDVMSRLGNDIMTYVQEQIPRFIMGIRPISEWDDFVSALQDDMGLDKVTEIVNASLTRYNNR
jgi:putative aldouronate transport system substrate-binding protein